MDATQIVLIVFIGLLIIAYPILVTTRNKKNNQKMQQQTDSLKRGDKVLTTSGVYGTIVDLQMEEDKKIVTIETGTDKKKGYISVDAYAIYTVFTEEDKNAKTEKQADGDKKTEQPVEQKSLANKEEAKMPEVIEQKTQEKPKKEKKKEKNAEK